MYAGASSGVKELLCLPRRERRGMMLRSLPAGSAMRLGRTAFTVAALIACACSSDIILIKPPPPDSTGGGGGGGGGGTVQRATLTITVRVAGADSALASAIGSPGGVLANALVTVARVGSSFRQTDTADGAGRAVFDRLLPGDYTVSVIRILTPAEVAVLGSGNEDVNAFGGGATMRLDPPVLDTAVAAVAGRRGSLVISEVFDGRPLINGFVYNYAGYVELYNNSDTTIYLDGKLVGLGPAYLQDCSNCVTPLSCADGAPYQLDPDGLWSRFIWRVPGSGRDHALAPGGAVVLATDAIDHSVVDSRLPDLSHADFEFIGSTDADNPAVPNLIDVGTKEFFSIIGHGLIVGFHGIYYVADTVDLSSLPMARLPNTVELSLRVPRAKILDVFASAYTPATEANIGLPLCPQWVNPVFDRQPGGFLEEIIVNTVVRRVFTTLTDGRVILLRTRATANDFFLSPTATPGVVP